MKRYTISASSADAARQIAEHIFQGSIREVRFVSGPDETTQLPYSAENTGGTWEIEVHGFQAKI